jgi:transposase
MGKSRRTHSREFKLEAVKQVVDQGRSVSEVADALGINRNLLTRWKSQFLADGDVAFPGHGRQTEAEAEIKRLKRELAVARQERDILKKAAAYFANAKN